MTKGGGGVWKLIFLEIGVAILSVLGKEIAERTAEWMANKSKEREQEKAEKPESKEPEKDSKTEGENGTS